jgi:HSP20 family protein
MEVRQMVNQFPFGSDFVLLRDAMNQLLSDSFVPSGGARSVWGHGTREWPVPLDVYSTPEEAIVIAAMPGMNPEQLEITYTQNTLTLSGSVPNVAESEQGKNATWYAHELWFG